MNKPNVRFDSQTPGTSTGIHIVTLKQYFANQSHKFICLLDLDVSTIYKKLDKPKLIDFW